MAAVRNIRCTGCLNEAFHTSGTPLFYLHAKFGENILISGRDMPPKLNSKQRPFAVEFYFRCLYFGTIMCVVI